MSSECLLAQVPAVASKMQVKSGEKSGAGYALPPTTTTIYFQTFKDDSSNKHSMVKTRAADNKTSSHSFVLSRRKVSRLHFVTCKDTT